MMKIPVYLSRTVGQDMLGFSHVFSEVRLIRQGTSDRVIAVLEAPEGSRVRNRQDIHGPDQLLVPQNQKAQLPTRLFGRMKVIPVKYVIGCARRGECGLSMVSDETLAETLDS